MVLSRVVSSGGVTANFTFTMYTVNVARGRQPLSPDRYMPFIQYVPVLFADSYPAHLHLNDIPVHMDGLN